MIHRVKRAVYSRRGSDEAVTAVLEQEPRARLAYVFGSTARGTTQLNSDLDVAVLFDTVPEPRELDRLTEALEIAAGRRADLVILNAAPPLLAHEAIDGRLVLCRDEDERVSFETRTLSLYMDTAYLRRVQYGYLREWAEAYRGGSS